jgi:hypothetical protein
MRLGRPYVDGPVTGSATLSESRNEQIIRAEEMAGKELPTLVLRMFYLK